MKPLFISVLLAAMSLECRAQRDNVLQPQGDVTATEGQTVTLDCQYNSSSTTSPSLYWYKQDGNHSPKFILSRFKLEEGNTPEEMRERFSSTLNSTFRSVPLKIQKLQVSDSAVYYCALPANTGNQRMIFGSGTRLIIEPRDNYLPSYYKLTDGDTTACLATGFSRYKATNNHKDLKDDFNKTEATRISGDSLYNSVVLLEGARGGQCVENTGNPKPCVDGLEQDPTVNGVTLTILGLRLLFLKTIIFNVLMTLRLWISH